MAIHLSNRGKAILAGALIIAAIILIFIFLPSPGSEPAPAPEPEVPEELVKE